MASPKLMASAQLEFEVPVDRNNKCTEFQPFKFKKCGPIRVLVPHCGKRAKTNPYMRGFWAATLAFTFAFIGWFAFAPLLTVVRKDIGICDNDAEVQLDIENTKCVCKKGCKKIIGNSNIAAVSFDIFMRFMLGAVLEKLGPVMTDFILLLCGAFVVALGAFTTSGTMLIIVRFFVSMLGATFVTNQFWNSILFSGAVVGTANATAGGWGNLGGGLTQTLMPLAYRILHDVIGLELSMAWRFAMFLPVTLFVTLAVWMFFCTQDTPSGKFDVTKMGKRKSAGPADYLQCLKDYTVFLMIFQYGACFGVELVMNNTLAMHFSDYFGVDLVAAGFLAMAFGGMNLFARSLGGILSDWMANRWAMPGRLWAHFISLFGEAVFLFIFGLCTADLGWGVALAVLCVMSIFVNMAEGTSYGIVPFMIPEQLAVVSALVGAGGTLGAVIGTWAFYKSIESTLLSFKLHAAYVLFWALTVPLMRWESMGSMFGMPRSTPDEDSQSEGSEAPSLVDVGEHTHILRVTSCAEALTEMCKQVRASYGICWKLEGSSLKPSFECNGDEGDFSQFTVESRKFTMPPGVGFVGKAYENCKPLHIQDISKITNTVFVRAELAKRFGVKSIIFLRACDTDDAVLELGTVAGWSCDPPLPYACALTQSQFGIYWKLEGGMLVPQATFEDALFVASLNKEIGDCGYIATACKANLAPGRGIVGMVSQSGRSEFHPEVRALSSKRFIRKHIARQNCIKSIVFLAMPGGEVLELCSARGWDFMPSLEDANEKDDIPDPNQALIARIVVLERDMAALEREVAALKITHAQVKDVSGTSAPEVGDSTSAESAQGSAKKDRASWVV